MRSCVVQSSSHVPARFGTISSSGVGHEASICRITFNISSVCETGVGTLGGTRPNKVSNSSLATNGTVPGVEVKSGTFVVRLKPAVDLGTKADRPTMASALAKSNEKATSNFISMVIYE